MARLSDADVAKRIACTMRGYHTNAAGLMAANGCEDCGIQLPQQWSLTMHNITVLTNVQGTKETRWLIS